MTLQQRSHAIHLDLVVVWLRAEVATLTNALETIEGNDSYDDEYVRESLRDVERALRQIRKYIDAV